MCISRHIYVHICLCVLDYVHPTNRNRKAVRDTYKLCTIYLTNLFFIEIGIQNSNFSENKLKFNYIIQ